MISITDNNALHILGFLEGPRWKHYQYSHRDSQRGFFWLRKVYRKNKNQMILHGAGDYTRYVIRSTGEIALLGNTARCEKIETAKALDITVLT